MAMLIQGVKLFTGCVACGNRQLYRTWCGSWTATSSSRRHGRLESLLSFRDKSVLYSLVNSSSSHSFFSTKLPDPSKEQMQVIDDVLSGHCVAVNACAGSGKTTCMLQIAERLPSHRRVVIITYNRSLANECTSRIKKLSLKHVDCFTIHSFIGHFSDTTCFDDDKLLDVLERWDNGEQPDTSFPLDIVMLDEAQDICPLFHELLSHIFRACIIHKRGKNSNNYGDYNNIDVGCGNSDITSSSSLQLCLIGDPKVSDACFMLLIFSHSIHEIAVIIAVLVHSSLLFQFIDFVSKYFMILKLAKQKHPRRFLKNQKHIGRNSRRKEHGPSYLCWNLIVLHHTMQRFVIYFGGQT